MIQIRELQGKLADMGVTINFDEEFLSYLSEKGYDPAFGARPIKRVLQRELIDLLAKRILDGTISKDAAITATFRNGRLEVRG